MINFDGAKKNIKELNRNCPKTPNHPYRISIIGDSGSGKTSALLNLIKKNKIIMIIVLLIKFIYMLKIHMEQNINILFKKCEKWC